MASPPSVEMRRPPDRSKNVHTSDVHHSQMDSIRNQLTSAQKIKKLKEVIVGLTDERWNDMQQILEEEEADLIERGNGVNSQLPPSCPKNLEDI